MFGECFKGKSRRHSHNEDTDWVGTPRDAYNTAMKADPDETDKDFFQRLRRELEAEISGYVYEHHAGAIGSPLSADYIRNDLNRMRLCLVEPHWEEVNICNSLLGDQNIRKRTCVTMAEDRGSVLVFDPVDEQYHLAWRGQHGLGTWGICGDGAGCFIAR